MDDIVKAAMQKWPNVPHCYGWLGLDMRGQWYMRDDATQALGSFNDSVKTRGSRLKHEKLVDFIQRNYQCDATGPAKGQWYFQNGPQRVYVELALTPFVWRVQSDFALASHTGLSSHLLTAWLDDVGRLYAETPDGFGLIHTQDVLLASQAIEQGIWAVQEMPALEMPAAFNYVVSPLAQRQLS